MGTYLGVLWNPLFKGFIEQVVLIPALIQGFLLEPALYV